MFGRAEARRGAAAAGAIAVLLAVPAGVARADESAGRGLIGGAVTKATSTLDGAIVSVAEVTGGAVSLPTTDEVTSTVQGTIEVVTGTVTETVAPVTDGVAQATLAVPGLAEVDGAAILNLVVGNAGDVACTPVLAVAIKGDGGVTVSAGETLLSSIAAGTKAQFALPWPSGLDSGTYDVQATASACGLPQTVELSVRLAAAASAGGTTSGGDTSGGGGGGGSSGGGSSGGGPGSGSDNGSGAGGSTSGSGSTSGGGGSSGGGAAADGKGSGGGAPGRVDQASATPTGTPVAAGGRDPRSPSAERDAGRRQVARGAGGGRGAGRGSSAVFGPAAPAALVGATGADRIAGVRGIGERATGAGANRLPTTVGAAVRAIPAVLERAAPALIVLGLIGAMFVLQEALARRDPKLALAPVQGDGDLEFAETGVFLRRIGAVVPPGPRGGGGPPAVT